MELVKTSFAFPAQNNSWDAVRYWVGMSVRLQQANLACQVMAGFALKELHDSLKMRPGRRTDLANLPNDSAGSALNLPNDSVGSKNAAQPSQPMSWPDLVKREAGVSDDTARNWMKMADGVKRQWKKLPIRDRLNTLMSVPPSQWQDTDAKLISDAVHKATDGRTQLEFMWELGVAKKPQGSGARGRNKGEGGRPKDMDVDAEDTDDELLNDFRSDMRMFSHADDQTLRKISTAELVKHQAEVTAYASRIAQILKTRKQITTK